MANAKPGMADLIAVENEIEALEWAHIEATQKRLLILEQMPYTEYLQTAHWANCRYDALARAGNRCQLCSGTERLHVHHNTYKRRGREDSSDLIVLCANCHAKFHDKLPESPRMEQPKQSQSESWTEWNRLRYKEYEEIEAKRVAIRGALKIRVFANGIDEAGNTILTARMGRVAKWINKLLPNCMPEEIYSVAYFPKVQSLQTDRDIAEMVIEQVKELRTAAVEGVTNG